MHKRFWIFTAVFTVSALIFLTFYLCSASDRFQLVRREIVIFDTPYTVWVADSPSTRERGLQNIVWLPRNTGMLFAFEEPGQPCFWNKSTYLDLTLVFLRRGKIVQISTLPSFWHGKKIVCSEKEVDSVVEIPKKNITIKQQGEN